MRLFYILLIGLMTSGSFAQEHVEAKMVANREQIQKGESFLIGMRFKMHDHWHIYWENPGFAGQAPTWQLAEVPGLKVEPLNYSWPETWTDEQGFVGYGYNEETLVWAEATYTGDASELKIAGKANWVACKSTCIAGQADLELTLPVGQSKPSTEPDFAKYVDATPRAFSEQTPYTYQAQFEISATAWTGTLKIKPKDPAHFVLKAPLTLFPLGTNDLGEMKSLTASQDGDSYVFKLEYEAFGEMPEDFVLGAALQAQTTDGTSYTRLVLHRAKAETAAPATTSETATAQAPKSLEPAPVNETIWYFILIAFLGGMILNLMPCVLPVLSLKVFGLIKKAGSEKGLRIALGWVYTLGILTCFNILAGFFIAAKMTGQGLGIGFQFQSPAFVISISALILVMALSFLGVFEIGQPNPDKIHQLSMKSGYQGAFFQGALMTILSTPCTAPLLGAAYGWALSQSSFIIWLIFNLIGLGLAFPYLILCYAPALLRFLPKPGPWMAGFKSSMGFLMLATLIWLFYILSDLTGSSGVTGGLALMLAIGAACKIYGETWYSDGRKAGLVAIALVLGLGIYLGLFKLFDITDPKAAKRESTEFLRLSMLGSGSESFEQLKAMVTTEDKIAWVPYSEATLEQFRQQDRLIFVDFTASWCTTCKVNERAVIDTAAVRKQFSDLNVVTLKADYTDKDDDLTNILMSFNRAGVPMYLVYPGKGEPILLPELLSRSLLINALNEAKTSLAQ